MGRVSHWMLGCCCAAVLCSGCASSRLRSPFAVAKKTDKQSQLSRHLKKASGDSLASRNANSKANRGNKTASEKKGESGDLDENGNGVVQAGIKATDRDAQIAALVDREMRDASPEEKAARLKELKGVHPDLAAQILRVHRMQNNHQQQVAGALQANPEDTRASSGTSLSPGTGGSRAVEQAAWTQPEKAAFDSNTNSAAGASSDHSGAGREYSSANPAVGSSALAPEGVGTGDGVGHVASATESPASTITAFGKETAVAYAQEASSGAGHSPGGGTAIRPQANSPVQLVGAEVPAQGHTNLGNLVPGQYNAAQPAAPSPGLVASVQRAASRLLPGGSNPTPGMATAVVQGSPGQPAGTGAATADPRQEALQKLIDQSAAEASMVKPGTNDAERQVYIEKQVYLRMLYLMSGQQERALQAIAGLEPADQEFWQQTFWGLANYFDRNSIPDPSDRATQTVAQLNTAVMRLQQKANLELRNGSFCQKTLSFGNYERYARDEFSPGQLVDLYLEVGNFHSEPTADGQYRTILRSNLEFHKPGPQGELEDEIKYNTIEDLCKNHRRDYYLTYEFSIPAKLPPGPHVLKVVVEDQLSRKISTYSLNFTIK